MIETHRIPSFAGMFARFFACLGFVVLILAFVSPVGADVLDSSLIVRFNFDGFPVGDVIDDTSPAGGHPGANFMGIWVASEDGRTGVMRLDGTFLPSQITLAAAPELNSPVGAITFWMRSDAVTPFPNPYAILFDRRVAGGDVIFQAPNGHLANQAQQVSGAGANSQTTGANLTDSKWHHVAYVYDQGPSGCLSFYVDGVLDTTAANSLSWFWVPDQEIEIGKSHDPLWSGYSGFLDDFRIYNRILTASEVADIAGLGTTPAIIINAAGQPQDITAGEKDTPSFIVKATLVNGNPAKLHYQWQKEGADISNATNATYSFTASAVDGGKKFRCQLTAPGAANVTSSEAILTVVPEVIVVYSFDSEPVADVIVDSTPNLVTHNGVNVGAIWTASEAGRAGVMSFDGTLPSQITIAPAPELNLGRGTIALWMKSDMVTLLPNRYAILFDRRNTAIGGDLIYQGPDGHLANQAEVAGGSQVNSQATGAHLADAMWHHVAYLFDQSAGGSVSFYVDGVLDTTKVNSQPWAWAPDEQIELGKSHDSIWLGYTGFLDEFRIYNRVLSAAEIATLAGLGPQPQIAITRQPANLATGVNDTPTLSVTATVVNGDPANLHYQWQKEGSDITGATSSTYTFTVAAADDGKKFRCQLSYPGAANVTTAEASLTVLPEFVLDFAFDAEPQAGVIVDSSPGGNNGVNFRAVWVASQDGRDGVMIFDDDLNTQITVPAAPNLNSMRGTIAFWMESSQTSPLPNPYAMLFDRRAMPAEGVPVSGGDVLVQLPDGHVADQAEAAGLSPRANEFSTSANPTDGTWHHVAYLYDQTAQGFIAFYVDGVLDGTHKNSQPWYWVPEETIELGKSHDKYWSAYGGFLDDFRIYNRVLSAREIAHLAGRPVLSISVAGQTATLSWSLTGFVLQENSDLGDPSKWTNVPNGGVSPVLITLPQTGAKFYRLKKL